MPQNIVIIGAGIVGLHIAHALKDKGHSIYVLEKESYLAEHTSGRNSGVIHAGVYYQSGSLKEKFCIEGNRLTYEWLGRLNVPHRSCGKWIVPELGQEKELEPFFENSCRLPIPSPKLLNEAELTKHEPQLRKTPAIFVPSTGILDAATYVKSLARYGEEKGIEIVLNCEVLGLKNENILETTRGEISFDLCVNAAGISADQIARIAGIPDFEIRPCRGDYYCIARQPISCPAYPLPYKEAHGLGIHLTPTLDGGILLGPNAFFIHDKLDYQHQTSPDSYKKALSFYLPNLKNYSLLPAYSGNRPKLFHNGKPYNDFLIHRHQNWIHLLGIESPGLTAAPAQAKYVCQFV